MVLAVLLMLFVVRMAGEVAEVQMVDFQMVHQKVAKVGHMAVAVAVLMQPLLVALLAQLAQSESFGPAQLAHSHQLVQEIFNEPLH